MRLSISACAPPHDGQRGFPGADGAASFVLFGCAAVVLRAAQTRCGGLENAVKRALQASGKFIPWRVVTITTDGRAVE